MRDLERDLAAVRADLAEAQERARLHHDGRLAAEAALAEARRAEKFWEQRYRTQHGTVHRLEAALAEAREELAYLGTVRLPAEELAAHARAFLASEGGEET